MNLAPFIIAWLCVGFATAALAVYRKFLSTHEDDTLHLEDWSAAEITRQAASARRFKVIDRWGEGLTILMAASGVVLGAIYLYGLWLRQ